ncbi:MAG TPA: BON domain-containing protein [Candidatus Baltobacteraceae bacterium]|nr:BON domain-containing protein [Candidatus Baltobacteraceae bacterium]
MNRSCCLALSLIALTGCSAQQQQQAQASAQRATQSTVQHAKEGYLVAAVTAKLVAVDVDASTEVHVSDADGTIALSGSARTQAERDRYVSAAKSVGGVVAVRDDLSVNPRLQGVREDTLDAALDVRVSAAIAGQAGANAFHIAPSARNGVVTLTGTVPSRDVDQVIVQTVRHVEGVRRVIDRITVK